MALADGVGASGQRVGLGRRRNGAGEAGHWVTEAFACGYFYAEQDKLDLKSH